MKITNVEAIPLLIPRKKTFPSPINLHKAVSHYHVLVKIETDEGIIGYGEAWRFPPGAVSTFIEEALKPILVGKDPLQIEKLWDLMYNRTFLYGRKGFTLNCISGIEIALWDILGKYRGLPVYEMIGGLCRERIKAYASLPSYQTPEDIAEACLQLKEEGYLAIKIHLYDDNLANEVDLVLKLVREAIGEEIELMVDLHAAFTPKETIKKAKQIEKYGIRFIEEPVQPMDDYDGLAFVRNNTNIPIASGENEATYHGFKEMISKNAVDIVQPDVIKAGGLLQCRKILALAEAWNLQLATHSYYFGPGIAATLHFCLSNMKSEYIEIGAVPIETPFINPSLRPINGYLEAPDKPGLGIEIEESVIKSNPYSFKII